MGKSVWLWNHYAANMFFDRGGRHYYFSKYLIEKGYSPTVFCASTVHHSGKSVEIESGAYRRDEVDGIPFVFVKTPPYRGNGWQRVKNMLTFARRVKSVAEEIAGTSRPDVILASSVHPFTCAAGIKTAKKLGVPCIVEIRDLWPEAIFYSSGRLKEDSLAGKMLTSREHWMYRSADALVFTKEGDADYIKERKWDTGQGGDVDLGKCHYINNGADIREHDRLASTGTFHDGDLESGKFNVIYCGSVRPVNDVGQILDCAALLRNAPDIQFLIYGDGSLLGGLKARAEAEGLNNVKVKGFVEKKHIPYILSKSSLNILNYSAGKYNWARGNSSNKLFEYMASGRPVLSTVKMGYCIISKYNCGISLDEYSPEAMAGAILKIKGMPKDEYGKLCRNARAGAEDFDVKLLAGKLAKVIESVTCK